MRSSDSSKFINGCWKPYSTSLEFLKLDINLIDSLIELNQIGIKKDKSRVLYAHYERMNTSTNIPMNDNITDIIDTLETFAADIANQTVEYFMIILAQRGTRPYFVVTGRGC